MTVTHRVLLVCAFFVFGATLEVAGGVLAGMGEGPHVFGAAFGAPITILPMVPGAIVVWPLLGFLIARRSSKASLLLWTHYLTLPFAVLAHLTVWAGPRLEEWLRMVGSDYVTTVLWTLPYVIGQPLVWYALHRAEDEWQ